MKYLPKRLEGVRRRGRRLCQSGWDVNALALLAEDVQGLAQQSQRWGLTELGERLVAIDKILSPLLEQLVLPDDATRAELTSGFEGLTPPAAKPGTVAQIAPSDNAQRIDECVSADGVPLAVMPPLAFIQRFAKPVDALAMEPVAKAATTTPPSELIGDLPDDFFEPGELINQSPSGEVEAMRAAPLPQAQLPLPTPPSPAPRTTPEAPAVAARAPTPRREGRKVYYLSEGNPLATELVQRLEQNNYSVDILESADELREMIRSLTPSLVIVDAAFGNDVEGIGQSVRLARSRASQRLALIAIGNAGDVATRLRAMRAGVDYFVPQPTNATDIVQRANELLDAATDEPFRVMIIEDDRSQALFAESILRKAGMSTCAVMDPFSALDSLEEFNPELILMDLYMPNCDGMELTTLIRERDAFMDIPIVFLSGEHDADKRFDALSAGGDDYLEKPIRPKYLISAVTNRVRRARALNRRVAAQNPRDPNSGLFDRAHVIERVGEAVVGGESTNLGGVLFVIIDGAHAIRERIGLSAFDQLMAQAGGLLAGLISGTDLAARYGDTSFLVLAPGLAEQALQKFGEDIRGRFEKHLFEIGDKSLTLAVNIGIAPFAQGWADAAGAINAAERACAAARASGGRRVQVYEAPREAGSLANDNLVAAINDALARDRFQMLFQPIASLHGGGDEQFQVLLRLRGEAGRTYAAAEIIPAAEKAGVIHAVDRWVLTRCMAVLQERDRVDRPVRLFVNQSIEAFADAQRVPWVRGQIDTRHVAAEHLVLEFRYAEVVGRLRQASEFFEATRRAGLKIALSNFEASLSAFQALSHLQIDYLKIAGKYVSDSRDTAAELRNLVEFARARQILLIAPMVEDAKTAALLWTTGVDFIQGDFVQQATPDLEFDFTASAM